MNQSSKNPLEWGDLWAAMKERPQEWIPTTEDMYYEMLDCLPPAAMCHGAFLVGEPDSHNAKGEAVYAGFRYIGGYAAKYMTKREFFDEFSK